MFADSKGSKKKKKKSPLWRENQAKRQKPAAYNFKQRMSQNHKKLMSSWFFCV